MPPLFLKGIVEKSSKFQSFYAEPSGGEGERCYYPVRLDTYGCGCQHNCAYCYARSLLDFRGLWRPEKPSVAPADYIVKKLKKVRPGTVLRLGGMTDCFMPYEKQYRATYQTIKALNARKIEYLIVTKSDLVADPLYMNIYDPELAHFQITVTSTSDKPNVLKEQATPPSLRLRAAETLSKAGFDVSLRVSPYIPKLVETERINETGLKTLVEFLRVNHWIEKWLGGGWKNTLSIRADTNIYRLRRSSSFCRTSRASFRSVRTYPNIMTIFERTSMQTQRIVAI